MTVLAAGWVKPQHWFSSFSLQPEKARNFSLIIFQARWNSSMLLQIAWMESFRDLLTIPTLRTEPKNLAVQRGQNHLCASKYHPATLGVPCPFVCLRCWTLRCFPCMLRTGSTWSTLMQSKSHLLLMHNVKCKSGPPRMFLYLLVTKTNYRSENHFRLRWLFFTVRGYLFAWEHRFL